MNFVLGIVAGVCFLVGGVEAALLESSRDFPLPFWTDLFLTLGSLIASLKRFMKINRFS